MGPGNSKWPPTARYDPFWPFWPTWPKGVILDPPRKSVLAVKGAISVFLGFLGFLGFFGQMGFWEPPNTHSSRPILVVLPKRALLAKKGHFDPFWSPKGPPFGFPENDPFLTLFSTFGLFGQRGHLGPVSWVLAIVNGPSRALLALLALWPKGVKNRVPKNRSFWAKKGCFWVILGHFGPYGPFGAETRL